MLMVMREEECQGVKSMDHEALMVRIKDKGKPIDKSLSQMKQPAAMWSQ